MFIEAIKSHIPIIGVQTDDLPNLEATLQVLTEQKVKALPKKAPMAGYGPYLLWTDDLEDVTVDLYRKLLADEQQLIVVNADKKSSLVFDAGVLPTPDRLIKDYLIENVGKDAVAELLPVLKGLSLKSASECVMMTMARTGNATAKEVRSTRTLIGGAVQGLYPVDTDCHFYEYPKLLKAWIDLNEKFFLTPNVPKELIPRGVLFDGPPGTGKTMAAKAIAKQFGVPLYRLDIATTMNRYIGESENRVARSLSLIERESPCVLLLDEVEKIFTGQEDGGTSARILSQLLWWLADHNARVLTVMTTNKIERIPPELYRPGRIDTVMTIPRLTLAEAKTFAQRVFKSVIGKNPDVKHISVLVKALEDAGQADFSNAEVCETVYTEIKANGWIAVAV